MLDFLLVLGQVPGTHVELTFTDVLAGYFIVVFLYTAHREFKIRSSWLCYMRIIYCLYSIRPQVGRPRKRAELPGHISLALAINIDFDYLLRHWRLAR